MKRLPRLAWFVVPVLAGVCVLLYAGRASSRWTHEELDRLADRLVDASIGDYSNVRAQRGVIELARRLRAVEDGVDPATAGSALQRLLSDTDQPWFVAAQPIPDRWARAELMDSLFATAEHPGGTPYAQWHRVLMARSARGLSAAERSYLTSLVDREAAIVFASFAAARDADVIGARYTFAHAAGDRIAFGIPPLSPSTLSLAAGSWQAKAALALDAGRPQEAERVLRELANAGVLLHDGGSTALDLVFGILVASRAVETLAALYEATGRSEEAARLRVELARASAGPAGEPLLPRPVTARSLFEGLPAIAGRPDVPPGIVFEYLHSAQTVLYGEFCRGIPSRFDSPEWRQSVLRGLRRVPHAAELMEWILWVPADRSACADVHR